MTKLDAAFGSLLTVLIQSARWVAACKNYAAVPDARETGQVNLRVWE